MQFVFRLIILPMKGYGGQTWWEDTLLLCATTVHTLRPTQKGFATLFWVATQRLRTAALCYSRILTDIRLLDFHQESMLLRTYYAGHNFSWEEDATRSGANKEGEERPPNSKMFTSPGMRREKGG